MVRLRWVVLPCRASLRRKIGVVDREQPADVGALEFEASGHAPELGTRRPATSLQGPKSHSSRSKKWMPMFTATPPDFSGWPFHETSYQAPRLVM